MGWFWLALLGKFCQHSWGSLLSTQEAGGDGIDWGDDAAALQITVVEAGTEGECTGPCQQPQGFGEECGRGAPGVLMGSASGLTLPTRCDAVAAT